MPTATKVKDSVLASAVDVARAAAEAVAEHAGDVGAHEGARAEGERLVSHLFACEAKGYRGWHWTVTVARAPRSRTATVCEVELLPGADAVLAPAWVPWSERLRPGDLGLGDVLPFRADDPRLVPGYVPTGDPEIDPVAIEELALARARILSEHGRDEAATRWYTGSHGPTSAGSLLAASSCLSCGFVVPLQGSLGTVFGVCANEWSPDDGQVVSFDHGCGAHSETDTDPQPGEWVVSPPVIDDIGGELEIVSTDGVVADEAEAVVVDAVVAEATEGDDAADATAVDDATPDDAAADATADDGATPGDDAAEGDGAADVPQSPPDRTS